MDSSAIVALSLSMMLFGGVIGYSAGYMEHLYYVYKLNMRLQVDIDKQFLMDQELDELRRENSELKNMRYEIFRIMGNHLPAPEEFRRTETYDDAGSDDTPSVTTPDAQ